MEPWHHLYERKLMGGSPLERAHEMNIWDCANLHPHFSSLVNDAMANNSALVMDALFTSCDGFEDVTSLVDIARGVGLGASMIVHKYPHIRPINFDLPLLPNTFLVLHDWNDEESIRLWKNCYKTILEKGKVIIIDAFMEENGSLKNKRLTFDMFMMAHTHMGKERTKEEYNFLCQVADSNVIILLNYLSSRQL